MFLVRCGPSYLIAQIPALPIMAWPEATDYAAAVQNLPVAFRDTELHAGRLVTNALGLPLSHTGNFAAVSQVQRPAGPPDWALKCFTRRVEGLQQRYRQPRGLGRSPSDVNDKSALAA